MSPSIADLVRLDSVCDAFEESWKAGSRPRLEEYLESTNLPSATLFVELVQIDIDYRRRHGETPSVGEYAAKFPQFEEALSEIASLLGTTDATVSVPAKPLPMLGRFELAAELGRGSFGVVWKAWDTKMRRWVALKQFHEGIARGNRKLYEREARAVAQLDHPNVVRVLELSEGSSSDYIVFELIEGESLKSWLAAREGKPVDPRLAAQIVLQIAQGLQHVHERDIVHRDLKPGNILITKEGVPKLVDFGLARHLDSLSTIAHDKTLLGTIPYMSPEQCRSEKVTAATDIYSLGVVLYELLAGRRPFAGVQSELLAQIQYRPAPPFLSKGSVPADLERICRRAIEKEPADRYENPQSMINDLDRFLDGRDLEWRDFRFRKMTRAVLSRRNLLTYGVAAAAACGASFAVVGMQRVDDGLMRVQLKTEPAGAKVAFIPVDRSNGRLLPLEKVDAPTTSPVDLRLKPGDYLVVAYFDDKSFHEVYRHVPRDPTVAKGSYPHLTWSPNEDGVSLPTIEIPPASVTAGMALIDGAEQFVVGGSGGKSAQSRRIANIPPFYVDTGELTIGEYKQLKIKRLGPGTMAAAAPKYQPSPGDDYAKTLSWDEAVNRAELLGKRLLSEWEYELISTARGNSRYPWGTDLPLSELLTEKPGPVGTPAFDSFRSNGTAIRGLGSNVAEWIDSEILLNPVLRTLEGIPEPRESSVRAVRGDYRVFGAEAKNRPEVPEPRLRSLVQRHYTLFAIGFRCARSFRPRLLPSQFATLEQFAPLDPAGH